MKFSYNWLRDLLEELDAPPAELARLITMTTAESEGVEPFGANLAQACAVRVEAVEQIPGSPNRKAIIDAGLHGRRVVVCGAPNCRPGIVTAWAPPGAVIGGREIGTATIAGIESEGMLASGAELGVNRDAAGILEFAADPGSPIPGCPPDFIIEIDNKSLTHRPDLWGHHGMAREVAAITGTKLRDPVRLSRAPRAEPLIGVTIEDYKLCPRYSALVFENVVVQPAPLWLQYRLESVGLNPINNIVDVTNYVMAELAQPMHAFDADKLQGGIIVRSARDGEQIVALNGETYTLSSSDLVIADQKEAIAIAGIIGGMSSAISESTTRIVLESANFNAASVRKTSARLKLRTDASMRFEKAQDPVNTVRGLARAAALLEDVSPGIHVAGGLADARREFPAPDPILLPLDWLNRKLGREIPAAEVRDILESLQFGVEQQDGAFRVTVPSWRATKDISIKDDLVEEIGRMVGYATITPTAPLVPAVVPQENKEHQFHNQLRDRAAALGYAEVYNYSFVSEEMAAELGFDPPSHVRVLNPIASDQTLMRRSLLPGILKNLRDNSRHLNEIRLFEIGREIHKRSGDLPNELPILAAACCNVDIFELKHLAQSLIPGVEAKPADHIRPFEHPVRAADLLLRGETVGRLFQFHPSLMENASALEVNLSVPFEEQKRYSPLRRYPSSEFDLSVIAGEREYAGAIEKLIVMSAGNHLEKVEYVRQYTGPQYGEGRKSISFRVTVSAPDHTLSSDEITAIRTRIIAALRLLEYELRV